MEPVFTTTHMHVCMHTHMRVHAHFRSVRVKKKPVDLHQHRCSRSKETEATETEGASNPEVPMTGMTQNKHQNEVQ